MKRTFLGLALIFAFVAYSEASHPIAMRRPSNLSNRLMGHTYDAIRFVSNTAIKILNLALRLSESFVGRIIHKVAYVVGLPFVLVHKAYRVISWPVRMVLRPIKALVHAVLIRIPHKIVKAIMGVVEFILPAHSTPFPHLPRVEFIYGH